MLNAARQSFHLDVAFMCHSVLSSARFSQQVFDISTLLVISTSTSARIHDPAVITEQNTELSLMCRIGGSYLVQSPFQFSLFLFLILALSFPFLHSPILAIISLYVSFLFPIQHCYPLTH